MKFDKKATSIVESMIVLLIIVIGITWLYDIFNKSSKLSNSTKNRIEAIEIAREGIEAMKNIRDTNWLMYWSDTKNCFNTLNYDHNCVWGGWNKIMSWSYKIFQNKNDFKWYLESWAWNWFKDSVYRDSYRIFKDNNWYYSQSGSSIKTIFTREINISYKTNTQIEVKSIVSWLDSSKKQPHRLEINNLITNWK